MVLEVWDINEEVGYGGVLMNKVINNKNDLAEPLPWLDPSINLLYKEAVLSYLVGNYFSAISSLCFLLEHTLRAALINDKDTGSKRNDSISKINDYSSLTQIISIAKNTNILQGCDIDWWYFVAKTIRNKSAHYIISELLKKCANSKYANEYVPKLKYFDINSEKFEVKRVTSYAAFYHSIGKEIAKKFLHDVTREIKIVISNTEWKGDESDWISLKHEYDFFCDYDWSINSLKNSFNNALKPLSKI